MRSGYRTPAFWRWCTDGLVRSSDRRAYVDGRFGRVSLTVGKGCADRCGCKRCLRSEIGAQWTEPASSPAGTGINKGPDQPTTWPAPEITKTTAVPVQVYGRRAEKRLLWLTFSAIAESVNRASEIAIGPAAGLPEWNDLRNGCWTNQTEHQNGSRARQLWPSEGTTSVFSAPTNVMATSSDGTVMVVWILGNGAASQVIVVVNVVDDTDYCLGFDDSGTASSYECTGRAGGATYVVLVIALDGQGGYTLGKDAQGNLVTHTVVGASTSVQLVLAVAEVPDDLPAYNRGDWRHWVDEDRDCQDTRNEVLLMESLIEVTYRSNQQCRVASGRWFAPYSGTTVTVPGELDIDHMVPLANAHQSGSWQWSSEQKRLYANYLTDPNHLIAVTARANRSKGARGPDEWKPTDRAYWCQYSVNWITIKNRWDLTATTEEFAALEEMLGTCDIPHRLSIDGSSPGDANQPPTPSDDPPITQYPSCEAAEAAGETRVLGSNGPGRGFPQAMVPSARDGDGDGVVCER